MFCYILDNGIQEISIEAKIWILRKTIIIIIDCAMWKHTLAFRIKTTQILFCKQFVSIVFKIKKFQLFKANIPLSFVLKLFAFPVMLGVWFTEHYWIGIILFQFTMNCFWIFVIRWNVLYKYDIIASYWLLLEPSLYIFYFAENFIINYPNILS